jgi:hypothetical protein
MGNNELPPVHGPGNFDREKLHVWLSAELPYYIDEKLSNQRLKNDAQKSALSRALLFTVNALQKRREAPWQQ